MRSLGYIHPGDEVWYFKAKGLLYQLCPALQDQSENDGCSNSLYFVGVSAHLFYLDEPVSGMCDTYQLVNEPVIDQPVPMQDWSTPALLLDIAEEFRRAERRIRQDFGHREDFGQHEDAVQYSAQELEELGLLLDDQKFTE
jgi:hypothetical protein